MTTTDPAPAASEPAPTSTTPQQGDPDGLGDAGQRAIAAERAARSAAETQLRDAQLQLAAAQGTIQQHEAGIGTLTEQVNNLTRESLRYRIALEQGLPPALAERLRGDDEAALAADAETLRALIPTAGPTSTTPRPDPSQGARTPAAATPEAAFAAWMGPQMNH